MAAQARVRHPPRPMPSSPSTALFPAPAVLARAVLAAAALITAAHAGSAESAETRATAAGTRAAAPSCDRRVLPRNDTLSVEAAARRFVGSTADNVHVTEACIQGTTTTVTLTTPTGFMTCERLPS